MGSVGAKQSSKSNTPASFSFEGLTESEQLQKIKELQEAMGQTGMEAGDPNASPNNKLYANTGKSMNINAYLWSDGKTIDSPDSNWNGLVTKSWIENAIKKIDAGMKPMSESVNVVRFIDKKAFQNMFGIKGTVQNLISKLESNSNKAQAFTDVLKEANYIHKAYTSTTYVQEHSTYDSKDIRLDIKINKGTPAIVTNNHAEHEIVVGKEQKYNFTGNWKIKTTKKGKKQLVLEVII